MTRPTLMPLSNRVQSTPDIALDTLARTIWAHGRDKGVRAMEALAAMAINRRLRAPGRSLANIVRDPDLFAAWDAADSRHGSMLEVDSSDPDFAAALRIARRALAGGDNIVNGADHFVEDGARLPEWAQSRAPVATLAGFSFYRM